MIVEEYYIPKIKNPIRCKLKCDVCGVITDTNLSKYKREKIRLSDGKTMCRSCNNKKYGIQKRGQPSPKKGKLYPHLQGKSLLNGRVDDMLGLMGI